MADSQNTLCAPAGNTDAERRTAAFALLADATTDDLWKMLRACGVITTQPDGSGRLEFHGLPSAA
jgi:hypothetical protein